MYKKQSTQTEKIKLNKEYRLTIIEQIIVDVVTSTLGQLLDKTA
jgi:hypothetical protein